MKNALLLWSLATLSGFSFAYFLMEGDIESAMLIGCVSTILFGFFAEAGIDAWTWYKRPSIKR